MTKMKEKLTEEEKKTIIEGVFDGDEERAKPVLLAMSLVGEEKTLKKAASCPNLKEFVQARLKRKKEKRKK